MTTVVSNPDNGRVVRASVEAGWWAAWWPGPEGGEAGDAFTVDVHTTAGTTVVRASQLSR